MLPKGTKTSRDTSSWRGSNEGICEIRCKEMARDERGVKRTIQENGRC